LVSGIAFSLERDIVREVNSKSAAQTRLGDWSWLTSLRVLGVLGVSGGEPNSRNPHREDAECAEVSQRKEF
jgi:hypothetical protein